MWFILLTHTVSLNSFPFSNLIIKYSFQYSVPSDSTPRDTYYVGLMSDWSKETNDVTVELTRIAEQCEIVSPQLGDICLSFFDDAW